MTASKILVTLANVHFGREAADGSCWPKEDGPQLGLSTSGFVKRMLSKAGLFAAWRRRLDWLPFSMTSAIFVAAFGTLAASFLPYMVPFTITIEQAAAPPSSLAFLFLGAGIIVFPVTLAYTIVVYIIFRGKVVTQTDTY